MKKGFTLAEVLITLGIIGVVAALTMPTLIQNYKKTVYVNQLKKAISTFEQGLHKMMADQEVDDIKNISPAISDFPNGEYIQGDDITEEQKIFLKKYFNILKFVKNHGVVWNHDGVGFDYLNGGDNDDDPDYSFFILNDGTLFGLDCSFDDGTACRLVIDVNGDQKGPNKLGRDIFEVFFNDSGKLILSDSNGKWKDKNSCGPDFSSTTGWGCAARIIENGWKMDY